MGLFDAINAEDIVLDEEAFNKAVEEFASLGQRIEALNERIENLLQQLKTGFDTSAGVKLINACEYNLRQPMADQTAVIQHISETLAEVQTSYRSVFEAYSDLNTEIRSLNP